MLSPLNQTAAALRMAVPKKQRYVASSDSSDKENRDPNIMKKGKGKKAAKKRKLKHPDSPEDTHTGLFLNINK